MSQIRSKDIVKHHTEEEQRKDHPVGMHQLVLLHQFQPLDDQPHKQQGEQGDYSPDSHPEIIHQIHITTDCLSAKNPESA